MESEELARLYYAKRESIEFAGFEFTGDFDSMHGPWSCRMTSKSSPLGLLQKATDLAKQVVSEVEQIVELQVADVPPGWFNKVDLMLDQIVRDEKIGRALRHGRRQYASKNNDTEIIEYFGITAGSLHEWVKHLASFFGVYDTSTSIDETFKGVSTMYLHPRLEIESDYAAEMLSDNSPLTAPGKSAHVNGEHNTDWTGWTDTKVAKLWFPSLESDSGWTQFAKEWRDAGMMKAKNNYRQVNVHRSVFASKGVPFPPDKSKNQ